jgi:dephospho-CoA kinase
VLIKEYYIKMKQIRFGITGNIGSGKTTVSKIFEGLNIPVFNSDLQARLAEKDESMVPKIKAILGDDIYINGEIDRPRMRNLVFKNASILKQMNEITIPFIRDKFNQFCSDNSDKGIVMIESAILLELNATEGLDGLIVVTASQETRIERAMKRDKITKSEVMDKINAQLPELDKIKKADYLIFNEGYDLMDSIDLLTIQAKSIVDAIKFRS